MNKYYPFKLINYLSMEFLKCLFNIFLVFLSLTLLINFIEEVVFFKDKELENMMLKTIYLTILKTPNTIIEISIFIFLFSGIYFFVKFLKNSEINTIKLSGISNLLVILTPSIVSFFIGVILVTAISPISSSGIKIYEKIKRIYSKNENLIVINNSGLWFMENNEKNYKIIRADKIADNDFSKLYNSTIYELDYDFNFKKRFDAKLIFINKKKWILENVFTIDEINISQSEEIQELEFISTIDTNELKNLFSNVNVVSFWEILQNIKDLNERGYSADELKIKLHKYLSLPIYFFSMIILATVFTVNFNKNYNNLMYVFLGISLGILIFFLNDLSIALGMSNKISLSLSVWIPIFLIIVISLLNIVKINEK